jgi:signal transduction histidine kinase
MLERLVAEKNYEITCQNVELISNNEELSAQHEEVIRQKEYINNQNIELTRTQGKLTEVNSNLEERIKNRTIELENANVKLGKTIMELDRFVYSASHDLSAPLKSVLGLVNIARWESKEKNLEIHLNYIEQSIKKQEKVIKSLIQYSRNSRQEIQATPLFMSNLVEQIISELKYMPGAENVNIINEVPKNASVNCDEQRLLTILNNLLANGINYRDNGKLNSFVKIQFIENKHSWKLIIKDNGQGIAEVHKEKIFDMFYRANTQSDGSGLGLFIVKEAVDRLGGTISLDSKVKGGSSFEMEFPN